jgi:hypothetical protein
MDGSGIVGFVIQNFVPPGPVRQNRALQRKPK